MILPDVNVLVYAFRSDTPHHVVCRTWLEGVVEDGPAFGLSPLVLSAVLRVATNHRVFVRPSSLEEALRFTDNLLGQSHAVIVEPGERHWSIFRRLCTEQRIVGSTVSDAWHAALAIEHGCEWITSDGDFRRFPGLTWRLLR